MNMDRLVRTLLYPVCIALLVWPALYNGLPILYSDTATYVASGMKLETPMDRPISYGIFIWITSLGGTTLWTTILCQAALVLAVLRRLFVLMDPRFRTRPILFAACIAGLSIFTSLPWVVAQIM